MTADDLARFQAHRGTLFGLAYRMLGDAAEAEDVVQDAFLRWDARAGLPEPVTAAAAWLTSVVTNLCLNRLTSARATRERYVGQWLPTPVFRATISVVEIEDDLIVGFRVVTNPDKLRFAAAQRV